MLVCELLERQFAPQMLALILQIEGEAMSKSGKTGRRERARRGNERDNEMRTQSGERQTAKEWNEIKQRAKRAKGVNGECACARTTARKSHRKSK